MGADPTKPNVRPELFGCWVGEHTRDGWQVQDSNLRRR